MTFYFAKLILYSARCISYNMDIAGATKFQASRKEVMQVSAKERILTIRLLEKRNAKKAYTKAFGIVAKNDSAEFKEQTDSNSAKN